MSEHESVPPSDPERDIEPHEVKKKASPSPLVRATDTVLEPRGLAPVRRVAVPLALAAAVALAGGGTAYAVMRDNGKVTHSIHAKAPKSDDLKRDIKIEPANDPPRLAGEMAPPMPSSSVAPMPSSAPAQTPTPPAPKPIIPQQNPPPMPGGLRMPDHQPTGSTVI